MSIPSRAFCLRAIVLMVAGAFLAVVPMRAALTQRCNWGVIPHAPSVWPTSTQVTSTPVVLNFGAPGGLAQIAFVSFANASQFSRDGGGVLRVMDPHCNEIARFPDPACPFAAVVNAPPGFGVTPDLGSYSGIAAGDIDSTGNAEIVGVIGGPTTHHRQIVAFNLVGSCLVPKWVSSPTALPPNDFILPSAPAIAQLDRPPTSGGQIILDNKVFNFDGTLRYTGFIGGGNNCATTPGGMPCPRSRTVAVANVLGTPLPQVITGRGIYKSTSLSSWTGPTLPPIITSAVSNLSPSLTYPAIAELDPNSPGPEIVVTDTMTSKLFVLSSAGVPLASAPIPSPPNINPKCGGPPMIGDADGNGPEIGIASCTRYTLFKYHPIGQTLTQVWSKSTNDPSGQTTSTLYNSNVPIGAHTHIVYMDAVAVRVFNGTTGAVLQTVPNTSATANEGPVIASLDTGHPEPTCHMGSGNLIVAASNYHLSFGGQQGVRIFDDPDIGMVASCWNEHAFHITNVGNSYGAIPPAEAPSWIGLPARNTYRVQRWP